MKIIILVWRFPPIWLSGMEISTCYLAEYLAKRGHEIHVVTTIGDEKFEEIRDKGFQIHRIYFKKIPVLGVIYYWIETILQIRKIRPEIVHVQSLGIPVPPIFTKFFYNIPYSVWGRGSDVYRPYWFINLTSKILLKNADLVIALTENMKQSMLTIFPRKIIVIANGIPIDEYKDPDRKTQSLIQKNTILFVGRLHPIKGIDDLIKALKIVLIEFPDAELTIIGKGAERETLEELCQDLDLEKHITFVGPVPNKEIKKFMINSKILVLPSRSEGFPVTILEAMACGLPIVATRVGGVPDIIDDGINGYLVEKNNPNDLAIGIMKCLKEENCRMIKENNLKKVDSFSWDTIAEQVDKNFSELI